MSARILFVCTGNVCRSPYLEKLVGARLDAEFGAGHGITVASRGTQAMDGSPIDERMVPFLREALAAIPGHTTSAPTGDSGGTPNPDAPPEIQHEARRLEAADIESADLIITATREHRKAVNQLSALNLSEPIWGELYMEFSVIGMAVLMTALGTGSALLDYSFSRRDSKSLLAGVVAAAEIGFVRGPLGAQAPFFLTAIFIAAVSSVRISRSNENQL